jgi:glutaminyl-tRNA synthetase
MAVMNPLLVTLTNVSADHREVVMAPNHPQKPELGERELVITQQVVIDADDFREEANKKFKRLVLGKRVRLRNAYVIEAHGVVKNDAGEVVEVLAEVIPNTIGTDPEDGLKPKGVIQWVSKSEGGRAEIRLYDRLFTEAEPEAGGGDFLSVVNPTSLVVVRDAYVEPSLLHAKPESAYQFEREGYFVADRFDHSAENPVFNRTIGLRDSWQES